MDISFEILRSVILYRESIMMGTTILAAVCAITIFTINSQALTAQRWIKYFGLAFIFLALQYFLQLVPVFFDWYYHLRFAIRTLLSVSSILSNLLFLATAHELLGRYSIFRKRWWYVGGRDIEMLAFQPRWVWFLTAASFSVLVPIGICPWCRLPYALYSAYCFIILGFAVSLNLKSRRRSFFLVSSLVVGSLYAFLCILYGFNPLLAQADFAGVSGFYEGLILLDAVHWVMLPPLQFGLFIAALFLLVKSLVVISPRDVEKMSQHIRNSRAEYLDNRGILESIGESVQADSVELFIKAPSIRNKSMFRLKWEQQYSTEHSIDQEVLALNRETVEGLILSMGAAKEPDVKEPSDSVMKDFEAYRVGDGTTEYAFVTEGGSMTLAVPVNFHGAVVGCLIVKSKTAYFGVAVRTQIKSLADIIAPAVQSFRENAALNTLAKRFAESQVKQTGNAIERSVEIVVQELLDILAASAIGIRLEIGFRKFALFQAYDVQLAGQTLANIVDDHFSQGCYEPGQVRLKSNGITLLAMKTILEVRSSERGHNIGEMILLVPAEKDESGRPILGTNQPYRSTVASLVADSILDFVRENHNSILKNLSVRLTSRNAMNVSGWLHGVEQAARSVGLLWVVAEQTEDDPLAGSPEAIKAIEVIMREPPNYELSGEGSQITYIPFNSIIEGAHGVVEIRLLITGRRIWFGVERSGFGEELEFPSPWKIFLERFAEIADSALVRLAAAMELENLRTEAAQYQGLATVAVTTGTIIHQIINMTRDLSSGMSALLDARSAGLLRCDDDYDSIINSMSESADRLLELTSKITNVTKLDERRPCLLRDAVVQSEKLFGFSLSQREIELENNVSPDLMIDVPFHVAALAIANLISNAKDAIGTKGRIVVEAENSEEMVHCHITDNGPGLPSEIKERIFHLGVTSKRNSGGWGLYLVARSLRENRGSIEVSSTGPDGTKFTIFFPKERREKST